MKKRKTLLAWLLALSMVVPMLQYGMTAEAEVSSDTYKTDADEMDKTMPTAGDGALAYMEFDSTNGDGSTMAGDRQYGYDISESNTAVNDPLSLEDVQGLENAFTIVFRAKLETVHTRDRAILSFSSDDIGSTENTNKWNNAAAIGIIGSSTEDGASSDTNVTDDRMMYYEIRKDGTDQISGGNAYKVVSEANTAGDGDWHTIAITHAYTSSYETFKYYVDGQLIDTLWTNAMSATIGSLYTDATSMYARVGRFHATKGGTVKGKFDWFAFYGSTLSASTIASLSDTQDSTEVAYYTDISAYRASTGYTAPTRTGYVFAGWYTDKECTETLGSSVDSEAAYAKFVPDEVLSIKAQVSSSYTAQSQTYKSIRFITTVDSLNYSKIGFKFTINGTTYDCASNKVYSKLYKIGTSGTAEKFAPTLFSTESKYFKTWTYSYIPESDFDVNINATPYWVTSDGTTVEGKMTVKDIDMSTLAAKWKASSSQTASEAEQTWTLNQPWETTSLLLYTCVPQGGYTDGTYYYQAFIKTSRDDTTDSISVCIAQYDLSSGECLKTFTNDTLNHANDITYNSKLDRFVVSHAVPNYTSISYFYISDAGELVYEKTETIDYSIISIDYNEARDQYVVGLKYTKDFRILDAEFKSLTPIIPSTSISATTQGVACDDAYIYFVYYKTNCIAIYDWDGNYVAQVNLESVMPSDNSAATVLSEGTNVEPENISVIGDYIYIGGRKDTSCGGADKFVIYKISIYDVIS